MEATVAYSSCTCLGSLAEWQQIRLFQIMVIVEFKKDRLSTGLYSLPRLREIVVPFKHNDARLYKAKPKPKHMASTQPEHRHPYVKFIKGFLKVIL
jgi:hypothetical protein